ncbi:hypothetical protein ABZ820_22085 [Streptomyces diacarni]|uniref:hypothetical protein n=1 Tax=Streptomyces diacarni TaxID=2800381 RepID=UPI0033FB9F64
MTDTTAIPLYVNGPVQNGVFSLASAPGKAVGIRLAAALNALTGQAPVAHLWNTVTLAGDQRHRTAHRQDFPGLPRAEREARQIAAKYTPGPLPQSGVLTDADPAVAVLARTVLEDLLAHGTVRLEEDTVHLCARCGHMTGTGACRACGAAQALPARRRLLTHLLADAPGLPLEPEDFHAFRARPPAQLLHAARDVPDRLLLCRTRAHGIRLGWLGLDDAFVLDPRTGLHLACLAAAHHRGAARPVMALTDGPAAHIAAYGAPVRRFRGTQLRYLLHGRIPYDPPLLDQSFGIHRLAPELREPFTHWYLPLCAARERAGISPARLPALVKFWRRAHLRRPDHPDPSIRAEVASAAARGDFRWVTDISALPHVLPTRPPHRGRAPRR